MVTIENIIFVDIDGVLLTLKDCRSPENAALLRSRPDGFMGQLRFNAEAIRLLVRLADLADARLVLSSNWRRSWGPDSDTLMEKLVSEGLRQDLWHEDWFAPLLGLEPRKIDEIADWLDDHPSSKALVFDDELERRRPPLPAGKAVVLEINAEEGYSRPDHLLACEYFGVEDDMKSSVPPRGLPLRPEPTAPVTRPLRPYSPF